ncbi:multiple sugar transport system permease protein [Kaistia soli DSM 19436]|uniref:Maltose/maltodextrin transport system permease protein MalG n=1 Tax=Kaistia soli DSM 19436 TaxID=1122133 RepID=A0A1M4X4Q9_9HYPH|nr:carbohydrate ABC transporter permease [Kaistia soli]SHE88450.1 multiple sugar transport system permease protein [Kaistia soli DSM 19436]
MKRGPLGWLVLALAVLALVFLVLAPMWLVGTSSFKLPREIINRVPTWFPHSFTLQHYQKLLQTSAFPTYFLNSVLVAASSAFVTVILALMAGYAFFRLEFRGRDMLYRLIMVAYAFPSIVILIPIYLMFAKVGLIDTDLALVLVNVTFALPFSIWMMRTFFASLPRELEEAAAIDGAGRWKTVVHVLIPLLRPGIAAIAIFAFVASWTEYLFASVLIISDAKRTLPVGLSGIIGQYQIDWGLLLAGASLSVLPVVVFFAFVGRWFVAGLTEGAVK